MKIFAVSGSGAGAGKTTLAKRLSSETWSIAGAMRYELKALYPGYDWFNTDQAYKSNTLIAEYKDGRRSMRRTLLEYGQEWCAERPTYWIERLVDRLKAAETILLLSGIRAVSIDDVRKVCELDHLRNKFGDVQHFHIVTPSAVHEPEFDAGALEERADYVIRWRREK